MANSPYVIEVTTETFLDQVISRSEEQPVIVDFWAPWCGPCRQLTPILEQLVDERGGALILAKVNIDEEQRLAMQFGVQSIPFVVGFRDTKPVDEFMGMLPEPALREWIDKLVPSEAEKLLQQARELLETEPAKAEQLLLEAIKLEPEREEFLIPLAQACMQQGNWEQAGELINRLETKGYLTPEENRLKSAIELNRAGTSGGSLEEIRSAAEANPDDADKQIALAEALAANGRMEEALELCLGLIQQDKTGAGVPAKEAMLKMFDLLGPESELAGDYRRKLAMALY